jgi:restriction system protein
MTKHSIPSFDAMMNPLMKALVGLGGSGTVEEIFHKVSEIMNFPDDMLAVLHNPEKGGVTEIEYRLAWTRTYLKAFGILENSARGVWALTTLGAKLGQVDERKVVSIVRDMHKKKEREGVGEGVERGEREWRELLLEAVHEMSPAAFERLAQRMLRESGFIQVEVTGRSGDEGIDGKGILRIGGLLGFNVLFQCKRYKGSVSSSQVRDFRGAMIGRADKGLLITTGSFTRDAIHEATRDGAPPIDLIDGDQFAEKLKELGLGVKIRKVEVEEITIDRLSGV